MHLFKSSDLCFYCAINLLCLFIPIQAAIVLPPGYTDVKIADGLNPTIMMFSPDGRLFVNEKDGKIRVIKNDILLPTPFATVITDPFNERGLMGIEFDPNFSVNHFVYVFYTVKATPAHNRISRFTANGDLASGPETVIFEMTNLSDAGNHNGGSIQFGKDGKLYIAAGNNANNGFSQSNANVHGKMLRINPDGTIPTDNPFYSSTTGKSQAIWALGLRNPFTFAIHPTTGRIFVNDVGGSAAEEISELFPGTNLGWPQIEGNVGTAPVEPGKYKGPISTYSHEGGNCAITGGTFFNASVSTFPPEYTGQYFFADFCGGWIKTLNPAKGNLVSDFASGILAPINIKPGPDGQLYYLARGNKKSGAAANTAASTGEVHRIQGPVSQTVKLKQVQENTFNKSVPSFSGFIDLKWPAETNQAVISHMNGKIIRLVKRSTLSPCERVSLQLNQGIYRIRYLR